MTHVAVAERSGGDGSGHRPQADTGSAQSSTILWRGLAARGGAAGGRVWASGRRMLRESASEESEREESERAREGEGACGRARAFD